MQNTTAVNETWTDHQLATAFGTALKRERAKIDECKREAQKRTDFERAVRRCLNDKFRELSQIIFKTTGKSALLTEQLEPMFAVMIEEIGTLGLCEFEIRVFSSTRGCLRYHHARHDEEIEVHFTEDDFETVIQDYIQGSVINALAYEIAMIEEEEDE